MKAVDLLLNKLISVFIKKNKNETTWKSDYYNLRWSILSQQERHQGIFLHAIGDLTEIHDKYDK